MNTSQLTNLEIAAWYSALVTEAIARGLISHGYHQNAKSLSRHIGRQVMAQEEAQLKGKA